MQKLHLVGFTTDHKSLILSARRGARSGGFVLEVDDEVAAAVAEAAEFVGADDAEVAEPVPAAPPRPQSALSVKELQTRLRSGRSVESVAVEAGVDAEWVARFAMPVFAEQARVIDAARAATFTRARLGPSAMPLGQAVYRNLAAKGINATVDELDGGWSTRQSADGRWLVTFAYTSRGKRQKAVWEMDLRRHEVKAVDRLAGELAYLPGAPKPPSVPSPSKPTTKASSDEPTDRDRANARKVSEARKQAAAQLAEAARAGSKRSNEAARKASAAKPKQPKPKPKPEPVAAPVEAADAVAAVREAAAALPPDAGTSGVSGVGLGDRRPARAVDDDAPARPVRPARPAGPADDPAPARPVRPAPTPPAAADDAAPARPVRPARPARPAPASSDPAPADPAPAAAPRPAARRAPGEPITARRPARPPAGPDSTAELPAVRRRGDDLTPVQPPPPAAPRPSRSLQRAVATDDLRGTAPAEPRKVAIRFRDDLAAPASPPAGRTDAAAAAAENGDGGPVRRRRGAPLRAR